MAHMHPPDAPPAPRVDSTRLQRYARAYCETAVLFAALDLELFTHVARGADTEEKLTKAMGIPPLNVERLVTVALAMGLIDGDGQLLRNAPDSARFLVKGQPGYAADWMMFTRADVGDWFRLTDVLRDASRISVLGMYADLTVAEARAYHDATYSIGMGAGKRFTRHVNLSGRRLLLDLGGGSGAYSINAVRAWPQLRAVVFDLPPVIAVAREFIAQNGVAERVDTHAGDFTRDALPEGADAVVMASNLPIYDEVVIQMVVRKAHDALRPGGEMHLIGEMIHDDRRGPLDPALWGMNQAVRRTAGKAHTVSQCIGYFKQAGFKQISDEVFVPGTLHRVSGIKAEARR